MTKRIPLLILVVVACGGITMAETNIHQLPEPRLEGGKALIDVLQERRSIREYSTQPLTLQEVAQLLWSAQGITSREGFRTAPSAGALYPLVLHLVAGTVEGLASGNYRYDPHSHTLEMVVAGDLRPGLAHTALDQGWIQQASAAVVISAVFSRTTRKYGDRGVRYAHMEAGYAGQNLFLQAEAMGLATVVVGAFDDDALKALLHLPTDEQPLSILPIGYPRQAITD
ncbi:MAG: SagB/ThcOx family dehydrogenase [Candidatus Thiodiazotropha sp. (ex Dulcina madagascariensis)]|nr:SagB/ThcOx family dehydrogenase [Candidatus Thiodiazotropha sp. (ex Dulcina madagascariensis)]MCU7925422.1 SagB/ThcOx family dehydrogenase [Candidatus Thiodiazotropha sp. (ex Dulcina madagascariensis)]